MPARALGAPSSLLFALLVPGTLSAQVDRAPQPKQASTVQALDGKLVDRIGGPFLVRNVLPA